jgi:hypothetical protein
LIAALLIRASGCYFHFPAEFSMTSYLFRKLSSVLLLFIFALIGVKMTSAAVPPEQRRICKSVSGLSALLKRGKVLLLGELHGTQEVPAFMADVVCTAAKKRLPIAFWGLKFLQMSRRQLIAF